MRRKGDTPRDTPVRRLILGAELLFLTGASIAGLVMAIAPLVRGLF